VAVRDAGGFGCADDGTWSAPRSHVPLAPRVTPFMSTLKVLGTVVLPFQYVPVLVSVTPAVVSDTKRKSFPLRFTKGFAAETCLYVSLSFAAVLGDAK